ncbi:MAG: 2-oxoisovalerate dehydrogenase [bacterium]
MNEIIFLVEDALEGGFTARALGVSIFTQGDSLEVLYNNIREAVLCHFDESDTPKIVRVHYVRDEILAL